MMTDNEINEQTQPKTRTGYSVDDIYAETTE